MRDKLWITRDEIDGITVHLWQGDKPLSDKAGYYNAFDQPSDVTYVAEFCIKLWERFTHKSLHLKLGEVKQLPRLQPYKPRKGK